MRTILVIAAKLKIGGAEKVAADIGRSAEIRGSLRCVRR